MTTTYRFDIYRFQRVRGDKKISVPVAYLPVTLSSKDDNGVIRKKSMLGMIDTGADHSLLNGYIAKRLGHNLKNKKVPNFTLGGIGGIGLEVYEHTFSLAIHHASKKENILVLKDFEISCHAYTKKPTLEQENFDALIIGTSDILCYFDMRIDFRNGDLYLTC